jgi:hypothetical protein
LDAVFVDGAPARITAEDFRRYHLPSFPKLAEAAYLGLLNDAIDAVYALFSGVATIWQRRPRQVWYEKTVLCYRLLTAWYITDVHPTLAAGVPSMGGIPLKRKKIGGVDITFRESAAADHLEGYQDLLESLKSNVFGAKAYLMITASAERVRIHNRRFV